MRRQVRFKQNPEGGAAARRGRRIEKDSPIKKKGFYQLKKVSKILKEKNAFCRFAHFLERRKNRKWAPYALDYRLTKKTLTSGGRWSKPKGTGLRPAQVSLKISMFHKQGVAPPALLVWLMVGMPASKRNMGMEERGMLCICDLHPNRNCSLPISGLKKKEDTPIIGHAFQTI